MAGLRDPRALGGLHVPGALSPGAFPRDSAAPGSLSPRTIVDLAGRSGVSPERAPLLAGAILGVIAGLVVCWPMNRLLGPFFDMVQSRLPGHVQRLFPPDRRLPAAIRPRAAVYGGMLAVTFYAYSGVPKEAADYLDGLSKKFYTTSEAAPWAST